MKSEKEIREIYERKMKLFAKTSNDTFLYEVMALEDVLEIPPRESDELLKKYIDEYDNMWYNYIIK